MSVGLYAGFIGIGLGLILVVGILVLILKEVRQLREATLENENPNHRLPK